MSTNDRAKNRVRSRRQDRGWSQAELAERAGISRTAVSAIEGERLVPSVAAALNLARVFDCSVEELFGNQEAAGREPHWAWAPASEPCRYWEATVNGRNLRYPVEQTPLGEVAHDGMFRQNEPVVTAGVDPRDTLVIAGCDPAASLLAAEYARSHSLRLLPLLRSSRQALDLLKQGLVHVAGLHLGTDDRENVDAVRDIMGEGFVLLRLFNWEEGVAFPASGGHRSVRSIVRSKLRWVGREIGSGARQCLDELFDSKREFRRIAYDHRGVAEAIKCGWADAGVCLRLVSEEAGLQFLPLRWESYDLCFSRELQDDPRLKALLNIARDDRFRRLIGELPGYETRHAGDLSHG